jgi:hypothetical protein
MHRAAVGQAARILAVAAVASLGLGAQCQGNPNVTCEVELPAALAATAQWMEVGVLPGACPSSSALAGGLPITGLVTRVAFAKGDTSPPPIGTLPKGPYAFAAVARSADCSVLATGCAQIDVTNARDVSIALTATSEPAGACLAGSTCFDARCVPTLGGADAGATGCPMTLVAAGPLGDPLGVVPDVASTPAAAATESGFLIAYREYDPTGGTARLTVVSIEPTGVLSIGTPALLPGQCAGQTETDAVGLGYTSGSGVIVSARPACGAQPAGFDAFQVGPTGMLGKSAFSATASGQPVLSTHALALTGATSGYLAYALPGGASVVALSGLSQQGAPLTFGNQGSSFAEIAADSQGLALLAGGDGASGDAGTGAPALSLTLGSSLAALSTPSDFAGDWGSVALAGARAIVLTDSSVSAQPVAWHTFDPAPGASATATFSPSPGSVTGPVSGGDVAVQSDLVFFAAEPAGNMALDAFDHASTTPTLLRAVTLSADPRVPSLATVRDGKVSVAASASQVLVSWVTGTTLGPDDSVGGWALYACAP